MSVSVMLSCRTPERFSIKPKPFSTCCHVLFLPFNISFLFPCLNVNSHRCEVGTENWSQCNDHPIKICKYPVSGLFEGHSYYFRVRAVNSHGISKASRMSDPIAALDPTEFEKLHSGLDLNIINVIILCRFSDKISLVQFSISLAGIYSL